MKRTRFVGTAVLVSGYFASVVLGQPVETKGSVEAVTVYRGQALVTRVVDLAGQAGLREVVVTDLPGRVLPGSIYAESADGLSVRSVQFRTRPVSQDVREDVRKLDDEMVGLNDKMAEIQATLQRLDEQKAYLDKLEAFVAPTAQTELTKGVLNAETLTKMSDYSTQQRDKISKQRLDLAKQQRQVQQDIALKGRERAKLTAGSSRTVNEAVVFLNKDGAGAGKLRVRYLVDSATWAPSYNARTDGKGAEVTLEYFASVEQMSGENWDGVQLELSTATPALVAKAPSLQPMVVALAASAPEQRRELAYADAKKDIEFRQRDVEKNRNFAAAVNGPTGAQGPQGPQGQVAGDFPNSQPAASGGAAPFADNRVLAVLAENDKSLNDLASKSQLLDVLAEAKEIRPGGSKGVGARGGKPTTEEGLSVTYKLGGKTSVPSRADRQLIQIASTTMKAQFAKVATPVLTQFVYDEARLTNEGGMVLLAGPLTAYSGGSFVGNGQLPTVAAGEQFTLGFGIDSGLRSEKELVDKIESVQGGNRVIELTYRLTVENFGAEPRKIRLQDRLPKAKENEIRLTLLSSSPEPVQESADGDQRAGGSKEKKNGLLKWELEIPGRAIGAKAVAVEYKFKLEYDKQMTVVGMDAQVQHVEASAK